MKDQYLSIFSSILTNIKSLPKFIGIIFGIIVIIELYFYAHFKFGKNLKKLPFFIFATPILFSSIYFLYKYIGSSFKIDFLLIYPTLLKVALIALVVEIIIYFLVRNVFYKHMLPVLLLVRGF